jgi:uncharacterized protein YabN with tetrapyrrole methylase and pyrophosphatase domain
MEQFKGEQYTGNNDYFANRLLNKLAQTDPIYAAYEAQAVSREVGFDFQDFHDVVPRALDEIRETKEAYTEIGIEGREHFGDEIADIMFSLINLARHAGVSDMPTIEQVTSTIDTMETTEIDTVLLVDHIGEEISRVATDAIKNPDALPEVMGDLLKQGMHDAFRLALSHGFEPRELLIENVRKYLIRCQAIETLAAEDNKNWADLALNNEIVAYWKKAKILLK